MSRPRLPSGNRVTWRPAMAAVIAAVCCAALAACGSGTPAASSGTHTVTDPTGRQVKVPVSVRRVVTVDSVPVLNSFLFAVGEGSTIVNGIPGGTGAGYRSYTVLAPRLLTNPTIETSIGGAVNDEELLALHPDLVVTDTAALAQQVETQTHVPAVVLALNTGDSIERDVTFMGTLFGRPARAAAYVSYFNAAIARVRSVASTIPATARPTVLYVDFKPLRRPNLIMEWMLGLVGANSVTRSVKINQYQFSVEQLLAWNPEILLGMEPYDLTSLTSNPELAQLKAVRDRRISIVPTGIQIWGNNTAEQPLALLWVAKQVFPKQFASLDLTTVTQAFYSKYFGISLSLKQAQQLLANTL